MFKFQLRCTNQGFTLVELSIVIIIIGFLIAGIAAGTSLVKQSQLNAVHSEARQYITAINTFKTTYGQYPGDTPQAYAYWGTNCGSTAARCNGNGDGIIRYNFNNDDMYSHEGVHAWHHMALAGLIPGGSLTGTTKSSAGNEPNETVGGTSSPFSKYPKGIWAMSHILDVWGQPNYSQVLTKGNFIFLGTALSGNPPAGGLLSPVDAQTIDRKYDDGLPFSGLIFSLNGYVNGTYSSACVNANNTYQTQLTTVQCFMGFLFR